MANFLDLSSTIEKNGLTILILTLKKESGVWKNQSEWWKSLLGKVGNGHMYRESSKTHGLSIVSKIISKSYWGSFAKSRKTNNKIVKK